MEYQSIGDGLGVGGGGAEGCGGGVGVGAGGGGDCWRRLFIISTPACTLCPSQEISSELIEGKGRA